MRGLVTGGIIFLILLSISSVSAMQTEEVVVTVDSSNLRFSPSEVTIEEGQSVRFFWSGEFLPHNAVHDASEGEKAFDSGDPEREVDYIVFFEIGMNGTYNFICEPHESLGMVGTITVLPTTSDNLTEDPSDADSFPQTQSEVNNSESLLELFSHGFLLMSLLFSAYVIGKLSGKKGIDLLQSEEE